MDEYLNITVYSVIYLVAIVVIFIYTIKHQLDVLCVGVVCYVAYTMYCFFGYGISGQYRPQLSTELYLLVYMQLVIIMLCVVFARYKDTPLKCKVITVKTTDVYQEKKVTNAFYVYTTIIVLFAFINVLIVTPAGFADGKETVWEKTNILYIISLYGAYPSFAYGIHKKIKTIWIPSLLVELTIFFAGSRAFATTLIILFLCERGTALYTQKNGNLKIYLIGAGAIVFLLFYRMIDQAIMQGDIGKVFQVISDPQAWLKALEFNEPRVIIANYDYVITSGICLPVGDILYRIIDIIPGLTSLIPIKLVYPEYFSDWLMKEVNGSAGVGGTFWGESYAMFGVIGVIAFTFIWMWLLRICNKHLNYPKPYSSFIIAIGIYLAWYINRLDFNRVGQSIKIMFLCFLMWTVIYVCLGGELNVNKKIKIPFRRETCCSRLLDIILNKLETTISNIGGKFQPMYKKMWNIIIKIKKKRS